MTEKDDFEKLEEKIEPNNLPLILQKRNIFFTTMFFNFAKEPAFCDTYGRFVDDEP